MKKNIGILLFTFLVLSCKGDSPLYYSEQKFEQKTTVNCDEFCPSAKLEVIVFEKGNIVSDSMNNKVFAFFKEILSFEDEQNKATNYDDLLKSFLNSYEKLLKEFPEETIGWEIDGKAEISFQNEEIINLKTEYYLFTGGAHGNSGTQSFFFDLKTGKNLSYEEIFSDLDKFSQFAESKFREKFNINPTNNINTTGFMFENDMFKLPETILFTEKGILLFYNNYEIASYADGPQELFIPFKEAKPFLNYLENHLN